MLLPTNMVVHTNSVAYHPVRWFGSMFFNSRALEGCEFGYQGGGEMEYLEGSFVISMKWRVKS